MRVLFECKRCLACQIWDPKKVMTKVEEFNGQSIELKYYECPECSAQNYVQVDNEKTKELLGKYLGLTKIQIIANRQGRKGKQSGKAKKVQIHLGKARNELQRELEHNGFEFTEYKIVGDDYAGM